jgi:hypothetical protein
VGFDGGDFSLVSIAMTREHGKDRRLLEAEVTGRNTARGDDIDALYGRREGAGERKVESGGEVVAGEWRMEEVVGSGGS